MAQNVYSLNVVGYINIPLVEGFNFVANQLDYDGTGMNNTVGNVLGTNLPLGTYVYTWVNGGFTNAFYNTVKGSSTASWNVPITLNPGQGAIISIPKGGLAGTSSNLTVVGQVDQGSLVNTNLAANGGYSLVASIVPLTGGITSVLGYTPTIGDTVYTFNAAGQTYAPSLTYNTIKGQSTASWQPSEPDLAVGQGFFLNSAKSSVWSNYFIVQ